MEVLYIEDTPEDADLALRSLRKHNLVNEVKLLEDGQAALDYLFGEGEYASSGRGKIPRLMLLDLKLPKISGLEVLARMKTDDQLKHIPVVVLTSSNEDIDIKKAYALGANSYIVKPVDFQNFAEAIRQVGLYWLVLNEPPSNT
ncbi:response regulator [Cytophagaceae bacterium DM2B3-1]|uniref:Response regulator n=1 Tax=Xanthocytophaga flava TaxID=3048013 RepID=A0ABT7CSI0_9BACT|nr:response regulator [Xanthocytophaga flavus]MDJ1496710.1 response regulator [Xanthocytophaga flavus]